MQRREALDLRAFTHTEHVLATLEALKERMSGQPVSDVIDAEGHQYVDLVLEGGGTLGIALLGYVYILEQLGIRFLSIAGTSSGAVTAMLLGALDTKDKAKSERLLELLADQDLSTFVDGQHGVRDFITGWLARRPKLLLLLYSPAVARALFNHLGLNPGQVFLDWMERGLAASGIHTVRELNERMAWLPPTLRARGGEALSPEDTPCHLAVIACETTTETKVEFPRMAPLFWKDWEQQNPARLVRASMSVPFFFYPARMELPADLSERELKERWRQVDVTDVKPGDEVFLVDGGLMSNFPIDVFHEEGVIPSAPTFGVKLGNRQRHDIHKPGDFVLAMFGAARHCLDFDFILRHPDYKHLLARIDTGDHQFLDFDVSRAQQVDLFTRGVDAAATFLTTFQWEHYKHERARLAGLPHEEDAPLRGPARSSPRDSRAEGPGASGTAAPSGRGADH